MKEWIVLGLVVLCATALVPQAYDQACAVRFAIWCAITMLMVACSKEVAIGKIHIFATGFLVCILLSGLPAVNKSEWLYWALRAVLMVSFLSVAKIDVKKLANVMMLLGLVFTAYFWWEYSQLNQLDGMRGLMRQKNYWAGAHFLVIPFCWHALGYCKKLAIPIIILMTMNIIMLNSRSAVAALCVAGLVVLFSYKKAWLIMPFAVALALIPIAISDRSLSELFNTMQLQQRFAQWIPTLKMIWMNPMGVGAGNWWLLFPSYAPNIDFPMAYSQVSFRFPHNDFLWVWAETGIFGIIFYLGMFATALWNALKKKQIWLLMAILGYMAIAFFSSPRERPFASLMIVSLFVIACPRPKKIRCPKELLIPLTLFLVVCGFYLRSGVWNKRLASVKTVGDKIATTAGYSPFTQLTYTGMPYYWWKGMSNYTQGNKDLACYQFDQAYKHNPCNVHVINAKGISYMHKGKIEDAKWCFSEALRIAPEFEDPKRNLEKIK